MKALRKDTLREIQKSLNRFLSIMLIIALGICFFCGISSTSPSMKYTADTYFQDQKLMDLHLISTWGFQDEDIQAIAKTEGVAQVDGGYSTDVVAENGEERSVIKVYSVPDSDDLNQPVLVEGRMPEKDNECVIEYPDSAIPGITSSFEIGDTVSLALEIDGEALSDTLSQSEFTIVGYVRSPLYISFERGSTTVGSGEIDLYMMIMPEVFESERYTDAWILSDFSAAGGSAYSDEYDEAINALSSRLETLSQERLQVNYDDIQNEGQKELNDARQTLQEAQDTFDQEMAKAEQQLAEAEQQLAEGEAELAQGRHSYETGIAEGEATLREKEAQLNDAENKLTEGQRQYEENLSLWQQEKNAFEAQKPSDEELKAMEEGIIQLERTVQTLTATIEQLEAIDPSNPEIAQLKESLEQAETQLKELNAQLETIQGAEQQLEAAKVELDNGKATLDATAAQIEEGRSQLEAGWATLENQRLSGLAELEAAEAEIASGYAELEAGRSELETQRAQGQEELDKAAQEIKDGEQDLRDIDFGEWYIQTRDDSPGYTSYGEDANRINNVSVIFPVFFLIVAVLVSFTTMTRMVEEQRMEIGTLKALGYSYGAIASKYTIYATLASVVGCMVGAVVGINFLPRFIIDAYSMLYQMPEVRIDVPWRLVIASFVVALICTVGAALYICMRELREEPSELMRPKAPKLGKRILLERVGFVWKRMGFISKVTARNIFRYKARFLMTVIGISGCTALILAGFGLHDSIFSIIPKQYNEISLYDAMVTLNEEGTNEELAGFMTKFCSDDQVESAMLGRMGRVTVSKAENNAGQEVYLVVPENTEQMKDYLSLQHRTGQQEKLDLSDEGAVITEKMSNDLNIAVGDTIHIESDSNTFDVLVTDITENYIENYIYISSGLYEKATGAVPTYNMVFTNFKNDMDTASEEAFSQQWLGTGDVLSVTFTDSIRDSSMDSFDVMNIVVIILLVAAGALAFVVLYNLTNINVSERVREIATIRVLGFYDREVDNYIYRENIILALIGIVIGLFLGVALTNFIIITVETDMVMFGRDIHWTSFVYAALFTMAFTLIVNLFMAPVIKKIDMVESLKSIE